MIRQQLLLFFSLVLTLLLLATTYYDRLDGTTSTWCHALSTTPNNNSNHRRRVAVIGATGRLGRRAVQQLLEQGIHCNLLLRKRKDNENKNKEIPSPPTSLDDCEDGAQVSAYYRSLPSDKVTIVEGDIGNVEQLKVLVNGCQACLGLWGSTRRTQLTDFIRPRDEVENNDPSHPKQVNYQGVRNLIEACRVSPECRRIVRVTGKGEDPNGFFSILINLLGSMAKAWNYEGEQALRGQSDVEYTIVRPGIMSEDGPTPATTTEGGGSEAALLLQLADNGMDLPVAKIRYDDVASLCVESLEYPNAARSTLVAMTTTNETVGKSSWTNWLSQVQPDRRAFPNNMLEQHYAAVQTTLRKLVVSGFAAIVLAIGIIMKWGFF